jgi:peptidyl-prolyl cis-trans isomerase-like 4
LGIIISANCDQSESELTTLVDLSGYDRTMSVVAITTRGSFVIDLYLQSAPMLGFNFLKLCKLGWFDNAIIFEVIPHHFIRIGHLSCPRGETIYSLLSNGEPFYIPDELNPLLKHSKAGLLSTCNEDANLNNSNFFITLGGDLIRHDSKRSIFGEVSENVALFHKIALEPCDGGNRPLRNIRIHRTSIIHDPFDDPPGFAVLAANFVRHARVREIDRVEDNEELPALNSNEYREAINKVKARQNAAILEVLGDIPSADARPPDTTLFVCKLSPTTTDDGLKVFFSRFGEVLRVDLIQDKATGNSLCYAFVVFAKASEAEHAFMSVQRAIVDGRPILVDFCQSVRYAH